MSLRDRFGNPRYTIEEELDLSLFKNSPSFSNLSTLGVIDSLLFDEDVMSICVNGIDNIYIEKRGKIIKTPLSYHDEKELETIIIKNAQTLNIDVDEAGFCFSFSFEKGINVTMTLPPLTNNPTIHVKCYRDKFADIKLLNLNLAISREIAHLLEVLGTTRANIIIAGEKNSLKTTLLSAMAKLSKTNESAGVVDYKDEFYINSKDFTNYDIEDTRYRFMKSNIINSIMQPNPTRLYVNDPKDDLGEYLKFLVEGYRGLVFTMDSKSPDFALSRLKAELLKEGLVDEKTVNKILKNTIDAIIFTSKKDSKRYVSSISVVDEQGESQDIFYLNQEGEFISTGKIPEFYFEIEDSEIIEKFIPSNLFNSGYRHSFTSNIKNQIQDKKPNVNILKKFKKNKIGIENKSAILGQQEGNSLE